MQTSGRGDHDYTMMTVPFTIFVVYGVYAGGGSSASCIRWRERCGQWRIGWGNYLLRSLATRVAAASS